MGGFCGFGVGSVGFSSAEEHTLKTQEENSEVKEERSLNHLQEAFQLWSTAFLGPFLVFPTHRIPRDQLGEYTELEF